MRKRTLGNVVKTKTGKIGKVYRDEEKINGKVVVHVDDMKLPLLCDPQTLTVLEKFD